MIGGIILGAVAGWHVLSTLARDRGVQEKLQQWAEVADRKAKEYGGNV